MVTRVDIPETSGVVITPSCQRVAIGTKRYASEPMRMPGDCAERATCVDIPETGSVVTTRGCEDRAIWTKCYVSDPIRMLGERV